jgi:CHAD domain-containing protein
MNTHKQDNPSRLGSALETLVSKECHTLQRALTARKDRQKGIHDARKSCRRLRSALPLLPSSASTEALDQSLRDLLHSFAPLRDAYMATRTARLLATHHQTRMTPSILHDLDERAERTLNTALDDDPDWRDRRAEAHRIIPALKALPWRAIHTSSARKTLKKAKRKMKKARGEAQAQRTPEDFHRWRRRARKLRYQLQWLRNARRDAGMKKTKTKAYGDRARQLRSLTDQLGWRQDFQIFMQAVERLPDNAEVLALRRDLKANSASWSKSQPQS